MKTFGRLFSGRTRSIAMIIFLLSGLVFLGVGVYLLYETDQMIKTGVKTEGVVVDNDYDDEAYYPVVSFTTEDGEAVRFTDGFGASPPAFDVGETVSVLYDPRDVSDARINTWFRLWFLPIAFNASGLVEVIIGLALLFAEIAHRETVLD